MPKEPIAHPRRGRFIEQYEDPETGRCMVRLEYLDEPSAPWQPTPKQRVILAIVKKHYRRGIPPGTKLAVLHRLVAREWKAECARQKLTDPQFDVVPGRDMVAYTLRAAALIA